MAQDKHVKVCFCKGYCLKGVIIISDIFQVFFIDLFPLTLLYVFEKQFCASETF